MIKNIYTPMIMLTWLVLLHVPAMAQYVLLEADSQYELFNYSKAADLYEQAYKKKPTLHTIKRLASCYTLMHNYRQAESWYAIAVNAAGSSAEDHFNYAKALQNNSKYSEAKVEYRRYAGLKETITPQQEMLWIMSCDSAVIWMKNPGISIIKNEKQLNSPQSDWGAVNYHDQTVFVSDRSNKEVDMNNKARPFLKFDGSLTPDKHVYGWTGNGYLRLYKYDIRTDSTALFPLNSENSYHMGAGSFTADGKEMVFTLTRIPNKSESGKGKLTTINVEIYSSSKDGVTEKWSAPVPFKYNKVGEWSVGDPFITGDGKNLYFTSTMAGGKGGTDLYVCNRMDNGEWDEPVSLSAINTTGNERSPFLDREGGFFFSSDGYVGMGGLDIFKATYKNGKFGIPQNLGYPINSPQDDFSYICNSDTSGYLASDRVNGLGSDDIYSFNQKKMILVFKLTGTVYNKNTNMPLVNAVVSLDRNNMNGLKFETDSTGKFKFALDKESTYSLTAEKTNFRSDGVAVTTVGLTTSLTIQRDLYLEAVNINKAIRLENIYYDFNKWNVRPDAAAELDKLVTIMNGNPTIWIELGSHTDSRGNDPFNMKLSQKRADSAVQYMISHGINKNRITAKGYGETQLLNRCANGVNCTEEEHQLNRRTEFKIVKQ